MEPSKKLAASENRQGRSHNIDPTTIAKLRSDNVDDAVVAAVANEFHESACTIIDVGGAAAAALAAARAKGGGGVASHRCTTKRCI